MSGEIYINKSRTLGIGFAFLCLLVWALGVASVSAAATETAGASQGITAARDKQADVSSDAASNPEDRILRMEKNLQDMKSRMEMTLQDIKDTGQKSEVRSYENKMMARELIRYVKIMVAVLAVIAFGFPFTVWLLSKKRILGLSGLSQEVSATLLVVEERQAKLANILKEIQGEIDYVHSMSVPDLQNLIKQAEHYLQQNETDLTKSVRDKKQS